MPPNTESKKVTASIFAAVFFMVLCLASYFFMDGMSGGYAVAYVSFFLAISSIIVALLFVHRARVTDAILTDPLPRLRTGSTRMRWPGRA